MNGKTLPQRTGVGLQGKTQRDLASRGVFGAYSLLQPGLWGVEATIAMPMAN